MRRRFGLMAAVQAFLVAAVLGVALAGLSVLNCGDDSSTAPTVISNETLEGSLQIRLPLVPFTSAGAVVDTIWALAYNGHTTHKSPLAVARDTASTILDSLESGSWHVTAIVRYDVDRYASTSVDTVVSADDTTNLVLTLNPEYSDESSIVMGTVSDVRRGPLPNATVSLIQEGTVTFTTTTDEDGSFICAPVASGTYLMMVVCDTLEQSRDIIVVPCTCYEIGFQFVTDLTVLTDGLVAWYEFNGDAQDLSGMANHGEAIGGAVMGVPDRFGSENSACSLDGIDDYILVPDDLSLRIVDSITIVAWIKPAYTGRGPVLEKESAYFLDLQEQRPFLALQSDVAFALALVGDATLKTDQWQFMSATRDECRARLFLDGQLVGEAPYCALLRTTEGPLRIGHYPCGLLYFSGLIDGIRIYDRALSSQEIEALYHEGGWGTN